jgi:hypothetical protein
MRLFIPALLIALAAVFMATSTATAQATLLPIPVTLTEQTFAVHNCGIRQTGARITTLTGGPDLEWPFNTGQSRICDGWTVFEPWGFTFEGTLSSSNKGGQIALSLSGVIEVACEDACPAAAEPSSFFWDLFSDNMTFSFDVPQLTVAGSNLPTTMMGFKSVAHDSQSDPGVLATTAFHMGTVASTISDGGFISPNGTLMKSFSTADSRTISIAPFIAGDHIQAGGGSVQITIFVTQTGPLQIDEEIRYELFYVPEPTASLTLPTGAAILFALSKLRGAALIH